MMRRTEVRLVAGRFAKDTTVPPAPWVKLREHAHLQKFKEFNLGEFPWVHSHFGVHGKTGGWVWGDAKQMQADRLIQESRHLQPDVHVYKNPNLPAEQDRINVPQAAKAVLASHLRGRPGGYGLAPEQVNVPVTIRSEKPELDTARKDEPRIAWSRWGQYREVEVLIAVRELGLSHHARRRFEEAFQEYIHEGTVVIKCDNYEDFWDNYEWAMAQLNTMISDARKADIDPVNRPMEQYKVRDRAYEHATESIKDWYAMQAQSYQLGEKYTKLKEAGAESVTGFNLYETPAYAIYNAERAARKKIEIKLEGYDQGYAVDKMSAAMSIVRGQAFEFEEEEDQHTEDEAVDFSSELSQMVDEASEAPAAPKAPKAKAKEEEEENIDDLLSDFVNPDEK
eukprot:TRINITY_DN43_c0_g2_i2.p1 TRINITY_DN43_c0_g2~~TRINITY_DN43_c0_g2_i2.p1  ORF type:complete len:395 (+),score=142.20 TRINITY_DN43_c0_g2_i2:32-1216(+)